jgi:hypothetical protein
MNQKLSDIDLMIQVRPLEESDYSISTSSSESSSNSIVTDGGSLHSSIQTSTQEPKSLHHEYMLQSLIVCHVISFLIAADVHPSR